MTGVPEETTRRDSSDFTSDEEEQVSDKPSQQEEEEEKDKEANFFVHKYTVDFIAEFKDQSEELLLHWALGKKSASEWTRPDDVNMPKLTTRFSDNLAC